MNCLETPMTAQDGEVWSQALFSTAHDGWMTLVFMNDTYFTICNPNTQKMSNLFDTKKKLQKI